MGSVLLMGFLIGLRHALDADHLAAVASLSAKSGNRPKALRLAMAWGLGHATCFCAIAGLFLLVGGLMPASLVGALEGLVGIILMALGADVVLRTIRERIHLHVHRHGERTHLHAHSHAGEQSHDTSNHDHGHAGPNCLRAGLVGAAQGIAGSAALVLLGLSAFQSAWTGILYILLFCFGTVVGIACLSCVIALPLRLLSRGLGSSLGVIFGAVGLATLGLGAFMVVTALPALQSLFALA